MKMDEDNAPSYQQGFEISGDLSSQSKFFDDDGRLKRTGTLWTASAHIITAVIGSGVLALAWATAQLGWIAGPTVLFLFSFVTYYCSCLLASCYRDPVTGKRNYTYTEAVKSNLGGFKFKICGFIQYFNLAGTTIGYTIAASISMMAIKRSSCFHDKGHDSRCGVSGTPFMVLFGAVQIFLSQIPDFHEISWLSIVAAVMSFTYSAIGLGLGIAKFAENGKIKGSLTGISVGEVTQTQKIWRSFQAFGAIAFAYAYSNVLIEIEDTIKAPPPPETEQGTMKKATLISVMTTSVFYMLCGCFGYAAFGDHAPGNLLTGFGFYDPFWLVDIANVAIIVHLVGAYQVFAQPIFAFVEGSASEYFPESKFITEEIHVPVVGYKVNMFRLVWRSMFVCMTTLVAMLMPFFEDVVGILGAIGFWPLTVYFPIEMYIAQKKVPKWSRKWICLETLSVACLVISVCAAAGSVAGVIKDLQVYKPFKTMH
ncbi:putative amino acid transporter, transmembrane domain-containing protein [Helianthus annuus]|nr:putative amino acid transporter, transmembrane domain-containing protein [Helianthus annuus]KAJ0687673.1 putative amino acid transporter, transmembrane domain-containing protein [Helianthus annuus]KAJ0868638.1 putative amino acid transporter, transmembrane domain-containing protein [Helianthus annuus]